MARKQLISMLSALALVLSLLTLLPEGILKASAADNVSVQVMGLYLTVRNPSITYGNGTATFDFNTKTLTLKGTFAPGEFDNFNELISIEGNGVTITTDGPVTIDNRYYENGISIIGNNNKIITHHKLLNIYAKYSGIIFTGGLDIVESNLFIDSMYCFDVYNSATDAEKAGSYVFFDYSDVTLDAANTVMYNFPTTGLQSRGVEFSVKKFVIFEDGSMGNGDTYENLMKLTGTTKGRPYYLWICGQEITSKSDLISLPGTGWSFDPSNNTLTVDFTVYDYTGKEPLVKSMINGLKIVSDIPVSVLAENDVFVLYNEATFECPRGLNITSLTGCGIKSAGAVVTIKDSVIEIDGKQGISGELFDDRYVGTVKFVNSDVFIEGSEFAVANLTSGEDVGSIFFTDCQPTCPMNANATQGRVYDNIADKLATYVEIMREGNYYPLYVDGYCVNKYNLNNILYDFINFKSASYDPETNTLTFDRDIDCSDRPYPVLYNGIEGLTVKASEPVVLTGSHNANAIYANKSMTITGDNKITVNAPGNSAIIMTDSADVLIKDVELELNGKFGIIASMNSGTDNDLTFDGASVSFTTSLYAIMAITGDITLTNCEYLSPSDAFVHFQEGIGNYVYSYIVGNAVKDLVIGQQKYQIGDVNHDGSVDRIDANLLSRYVAGWDGYEEKIFKDCADLNNDSEINRIDANILSRCVADWDGYREKYIK